MKKHPHAYIPYSVGPYGIDVERILTYMFGTASRDDPLSVLRIAHERWPVFRMRMSNPHHCMVILVIEGRGYYQTEDACYTVEKGDAFLYGPGPSSEYGSHPDYPMELLVVDFLDDAAQGLLPTLFGHSQVAFALRQPELCQQLFFWMLEAADHSHDLCRDGLQLLLRTMADTSYTGESPSGGSAQTFRRCRIYMQDHFQHLTCLEEVAEGCDITPAYLSRLFKEHTGVTPRHYLRSLRVNHGRYLLTSTALPISEVAERVGYADAFIFSKAFKQVTGAAPSTLRK